MNCTKKAGSNHLTGYRTDGCRCAECRAANADAMKHWRWRTGRVKHKLVPVDHDE